MDDCFVEEVQLSIGTVSMHSHLSLAIHSFHALAIFVSVPSHSEFGFAEYDDEYHLASWQNLFPSRAASLFHALLRHS